MTHLSTSEKEQMKVVKEQVAKICRDEETKWAQCANLSPYKNEVKNTKYFHLIASGKHRKKNIFQLEQDEGAIIGHENIKKIIESYNDYLGHCRIVIFLF
jgi:hypothetical protein